MNLWRYAFDTPNRPNRTAVLRAAAATIAFPTSLALLYLWLVPSGCALGQEPDVYRWTCLLPGLLVAVPAVAAIALSIVADLNRRLGYRLPGGWLVTIGGFAVLTHTIAVGSYLLLLDPAYRNTMVWELVSIPQPFTAGVIASAFFWLALHARVGRGTPG